MRLKSLHAETPGFTQFYTLHLILDTLLKNVHHWVKTLLGIVLENTDIAG